MNRSLRTSCIAILLLLSLNTEVKTQHVFIDSIRNMLTDLDSSIQYAPINKLILSSIPLCKGDNMNVQLTSALKNLISEDHILLVGLVQAVSPHLLNKYFPFIRRLAQYFTDNGTADQYQENIMRMVMVLLRSPMEKEGLPYYNQAREMLLQTRFTEPFSIAKQSFYLAKTYYDKYKPDSTYILYKQSLLQNPGITTQENILYANTLLSLAIFCYEQNKRDSAYLLFQQQLQTRKKIYAESSCEYAYWLIVTADYYTYLAKYNEAQAINFRALEITRSALGENTNQYALCLNDIGEVYYRLGEYHKALPYALQSLAIKRKIFGNGYFDNVVSLHNLATLYTRMGLYNDAIPLLQESLSISKNYFGENMVYSFDLHPLAEVYEYLGEYEKALPLYQKSIQIQKQFQKVEGTDGKNVFYPGVLHSTACLYTKLGQFDKAIEYFEETLSIKKEVFGEMTPEYTKSLNSYAEVCLLKNDYKKALALQQQSLMLTKKLFGKTHPNIATGLYNLASLYYEENNYQKAEVNCLKALQMQTKIFGERHPDIAVSLDMLGNISRQMKRNSEAVYYYRRAFEIRKKIMSPTHPGYFKSLYNLGTVSYKKDKIKDAAKLLMEADNASLQHISQSYESLSEEEKLTYLHNTEKQFQYLPSLVYLHKTNNPEIINRIYSDALVLKSMVLFQQQQIYNNIRKGRDSIGLKLYNQWRFNKSFLGQQLLLPQALRRSDFDSLKDATTQTEEQLSRISASFRNNSLQYISGISQISGHLAQDAAAIEFIRFRLYNNKWTDSIIYAALVLLPGKSDASFIPLCEEKQLNKLLQYSNNSGAAAVNYLYPVPGVETPVSRDLYRLIWQPLQPLLKGINSIYYSPSGLLCKLSFAAIHTGHGKLLADEYNLKQLICTRSIAYTENKYIFSNASVWGGIDYNYGSAARSPMVWKTLPGTKREAENIYSLLNEKNIVCTKKTDSAANEGEFKKMDGNSPSLLHIATHGFFLPPSDHFKTESLFEHNSFSAQQSPMFRTGLLLAGSNLTWGSKAPNINAEDGVLTAYEISQLDLSNTQMVILSACETASGEIQNNEGVFGLQRAFKMAGVKQVLMSLWSVPDEETNHLMMSFYNFLLQSNDANTALHEAQLMMKKKYSPYYWAAFVLAE
jgi:CHAT domain-containing protein